MDRKFQLFLTGGRVAGGHDGSPLPEDGIKIKKGKLRGVESYGMMCSIEELVHQENSIQMQQKMVFIYLVMMPK